MLLQLPDELLLLVFSFIPARTLLRRLSVVCKRFHNLLLEEWAWKNRFKSKCGCYPLVSSLPHSLSRVQQACVDGDFVDAARRHERSGLDTLFLNASSGGLDCVHLTHHDVSGVGKMVAAGSRDHLIYLWKLRQDHTKEEQEREKGRAMRRYTSAQLSGHRGWVWCLASHHSNPNVLFSGGWDAAVLAWDVSVGRMIERVNDRGDKGAVLGLSHLDPAHIVSAWSTKQVRIFDLRQKPITSSLVGRHSRAVLSVAASDHMIYSSSEDGVVAVWDTRRANEELARHKHSSSVTSLCLSEGFLSCSSGLDAFLYTVDNGQLTLERKFSTNHTKLLTSVYHNLAMLVTGSKDKTVEMFAMSEKRKNAEEKMEEEDKEEEEKEEEEEEEEKEQCVYSFTDHHGDICCIDYRYDTLAIASADRTVSLLMVN